MDETRGALVALEGVTKNFGGVRALHDASLAVEAGEVVGLVGDNGAGKSTLIKTITGVHQPDGGRLLIDGRPVTIASPEQARELGIEAIYQDLALVGTFDLGSNFFLGREPVRTYLGGLVRLLDRRRMREEAQAVLRERVGIEITNPYSPAFVLSGGQRQAIAIGRAIHAEARLIIMDEPTAALGVEETERVLAIIETLREQGVAVILVSHTLEHVFRVTDRIAVMHRGGVTAVVQREDVTRAEVVGLIMGSTI
ncbi:MAG: ATP-binding cassette domain-containing protein [Pseudomonadota bacterium]